MIIELNKAFKHIEYHDKNHEYFNKKIGKKLIPTTTKKKEFQNQFQNKDFWLKKKAIEANLEPHEMQDIWDEKRIVGTTRGSILHDFTEHLSHRRVMDLPLNMTGMATLKRQALNYIKDHQEDVTIATELVIGNEEIGGQIDRLFDRNDKLFIGDIKTDSKTEEELKNSYGKKMLKHLSHLDDCILNGYFVQLNIYRELLEEKGFEVAGMEIYHFCIHHDNYKTYAVPKFNVLKP